MARTKENKTHRLICYHKYDLTEEQQRFLESDSRKKSFTSAINIVNLARDCYRDDTIDEHRPEFKSVKNFLVAYNRGNEAYDYDDKQIEFIKANGELMRPIEIARTFFPDSNTNLSKESQTIGHLTRALGVEYVDESEQQEAAFGEYQAPKSEGRVIKLINEADINANYGVKTNSDPRKKDCINALKRNMSTPRFVLVANSINRPALRRFFENQFVRLTYDKADLTGDETDSYISLCKAYVDEVLLAEQMAQLNDRLAENLGEDETSKKMSMTFAEALKSKEASAKGLRDYIAKVQKHLIESRNEKLERMGQLNESLNSYIELVQLEKGREIMNRLSESREIELKEEAKKMHNFDDLTAQIFGISIDEILRMQ
jgi:hypothetical protein